MVGLREPDWEEIEEAVSMMEIGVDLDDRQLWIIRSFVD